MWTCKSSSSAPRRCLTMGACTRCCFTSHSPRQGPYVLLNEQYVTEPGTPANS
jgi:hypothetical protein